MDWSPSFFLLVEGFLFPGLHNKPDHKLGPATLDVRRRDALHPPAGESIHKIKPAVLSRNLRGGDPVRQFLPRLSPPDSPVVTTQFGGHFQAVVRKHNSVTGRRGVTSEQVHIMPVHGHHQVPEGPLISDSTDSGFFSSHILDIIPGREVQMVTTTILGFHECFKAATKIKTFESSLGRALP